MKVRFYDFLLTAAVLVTAACHTKPAPEPVDPVGPDTPTTVRLNFEAGLAPSRTTFVEPDADRYPVIWLSGDQVKILVNGAEVNTSSDKGVAAVTPLEDGTRGSFSLTIPAPATGESVSLGILSPAAAFDGISSGKALVTIPSQQVPTSRSVGPDAMLLWASGGPYGTIPDKLSLTFSHATAYGCICLEGFPQEATLSQVCLSSGRNLAGKYALDLATGQLDAVDGVSELVLRCTDPKAVWFACAPGDWSGSSLDVTVETSAGTISRTIEFPESRVMTAGQIATFSVDLTETPAKSDEFDPSQVVLSFGAISDVHINSTSNAYADKMRSALQQLKSKASETDSDGIDGIVVAGDLTDQPASTRAQIGYFKTIYEQVFRPQEVPMIYTIGNHDANPSYWWTSNTIIQAAVMSEVLGATYFLCEQPDSKRASYECRHDVIGNRLHVLSITPTGTYPVTYPAEAKAWLDEELAGLTETDPESFIVVNTHPMIENTTYGSLLGTPMGIAQSDIWSADDAWATRDLTDILKKYPQVVTFGGHLHFPLNDPRSIHQGDFTSFGCASVRYMAIENGKYQDMRGSTVMNDCEQFSQGWLIQLDVNGNMRATAMDFYHSAVIGTPYDIPYPRADKSHLSKYGSDRATRNHSPQLDPSKVVVTTRQLGTQTSGSVTWAAADDDEFVHHYVLELTKDGLSVLRYKYLADFYLHPQPSGMKQSWTSSLGSLSPGNYQLTLTAYDSWDASVTCTQSFTVEAPKPVEPAVYADIDFGGGAITDRLGKLQITNRDASVSEMTLSHAGVSHTLPALQCGASKYVTCQFGEVLSTSDMTALLSGGFSVEAMFVDRAPGAGSITTHGVVCGTQAGGWGLALRPSGAPYFIVGEGASNTWKSVDGSAALSTTELTHVVCTYDVFGGKMHIYINGKLSASTPITGVYNNGSGTAYNRFCLGADISLTDGQPDFPCTDMVITDAKFYTGALDAAAVQAAYQAAVAAL